MQKDMSRPGYNQVQLEVLIEQLGVIIAHLYGLEDKLEWYIRKVHPDHLQSSRNLIHYLAMRQFDIRPMQRILSSLGLTSLGRVESHVLASLNELQKVLHILARTETAHAQTVPPVSFETGRELLTARTRELLGEKPNGRYVRMMITMPSEAATNKALVEGMLDAGMECVRINCAHDNHETWLKMIRNLREAEKKLGKSCKILMDLAGPKLRTGSIRKLPGVRRWKSPKDAYGKKLRLPLLWIGPAEHLPEGLSFDAILPVNPRQLHHLQPGMKMRIENPTGETFKFKVVQVSDTGCLVQARKRGFVTNGARLSWKKEGRGRAEVRITAIPLQPLSIWVRIGDKLLITRSAEPGVPAVYDESNNLLSPARISCSAPEVFEAVKMGEAVKLDDGKIEGIVRETDEQGMMIEITKAMEGRGSKVGEDKGINFPESDLKISGLTEKDLQDLDFVTQYADIVSLSFVNYKEDVESFQAELAKRHAGHLSTVVKIETQRGFRNLPWILLAAMRNKSVGVMIARGDLAVECGWVRMAEIQEEILWFCEAAHVPVIWATQVLENMTKTGLPSRAEITDAAMSQRAECVMLNKGPHILASMRVLDNILNTMQAHQIKKTSMLRPLAVSNILNGGMVPEGHYQLDVDIP